MVTERSICLDGKTCTAVISDEPEALLAAKAAGRAVVGVESERTGIWELKGVPYVLSLIHIWSHRGHNAS